MGGGGIDQAIAEGVDEVVVFAVFEGDFAAGGVVAVGVHGADEALAMGMDEEARVAGCGEERGTDDVEAFGDEAGALADKIAGAAEDIDVGARGLVVAGAAGGIAAD